MALAVQREHDAYRSLLMLAGAVLPHPEPMLARLIRGCIAMAFTARVAAVALHCRLQDAAKCWHCLADAVKDAPLPARDVQLP